VVIGYGAINGGIVISRGNLEVTRRRKKPGPVPLRQEPDALRYNMATCCSPSAVLVLEKPKHRLLQPSG
jgi:hypothetical protein